MMQRTFPGIEIPIVPPIKTKEKRNNTKVKTQEPGLFENEIPKKHRPSKATGELKNKTKERKQAEKEYERHMVAYKRSEKALQKKIDELRQIEKVVLHSTSEREQVEKELRQNIWTLKDCKDKTSALKNIRVVFQGRKKWETKIRQEEKNIEKKEENETEIAIKAVEFQEKKSALEKSIDERKNKLEEEWKLIEKVAQEQIAERTLIDDLEEELRNARKNIEEVKQKFENLEREAIEYQHQVAKFEWQESKNKHEASAEALRKSITALEKSIEGLKEAKNEWKQSIDKWQADKRNFDGSKNADFPSGDGGRI